MRLLNTTSIEVERFTGKVPPYAILSHRWEDDEVTLEDMKPGGAGKGMKGYRKLRLGCAMAARQGLNYIWIDTCCIDKTSSAELSEAINSMFRYYEEAKICYTYLSDVAFVNIPISSKNNVSDFYKSDWFTRGWTLQELIAPKNQRFYNKEWDYLGTKTELKDAICYITKIPEKILLGGDLTDESVSRKMSWVSSRQTTVPEDIAYCLLGVFDVNIPLLYGEGEEKAFLRLQEAILKSTDDESIFLWCSTEAETTSEPFWGLLAKSPSYFSRSPDIAAPCTMTIASNTPATLTGRGVNVEFLLALIPNDVSQSTYSTIIFVDGGKRAYGILLQKLSYSGGQFARVGVDILLEIDNNMKINSSKLPHRILSRLDIDFDPQLKEPQALRFYVRQNPKIPSVISNEAAGFYFDPEKSLPPSMDVDDWSSWWSRWERAQGPFANFGAIYLLEFEADQHLKPLVLKAPLSGLPREWKANLWKSKLFGILNLSEKLSGSPIRLVLCAGLQQTSVNFLNTPLSYHRPWCYIYESSDLSQNPDQILKTISSSNSELLLAFESGDLADVVVGFGSESNYVAFFDLQVRNGQVYYLTKVTRRAPVRIIGVDEEDVKAEESLPHYVFDT
jgi:hypothetical protein